MLKRICDVCGKDMPADVEAYKEVRIVAHSESLMPATVHSWDVCCSCEQAIKACIGNRRAKAEGNAE